MTGMSLWRMVARMPRARAAWNLAVAGTLAAVPFLAHAADAPGVSPTEIRIGATFPFSGPVSALGGTGKGLAAYVESINERGGINGRKIKLLLADDGYAPPKAVEMTRRLVESDEVAFIFGSLGTPSVAATIKYVNDRKVPHLFVTSGAAKFTNFKEFPYTTTGLVSYGTEGVIYAR
jgi:branched-chain amino acid transport system substrate-binding protein